MASTPAYIDPETGQVYDGREWIINERDGKVTKIKRISEKQLSYIESLERSLGYVPKSHANMPAYKAGGYIERLQARLAARPPGLFGPKRT